MSYDPLSAQEAKQIADELKIELAGQARRIELAGSLRRGKVMVKDIELVIIPHHLPSLLTRIDNLLLNNLMTKRRSDKTDNLIAWGEKYRACVYKRIYPVDIFFATEDNFGFIYWLRTGPGDANTRVMELLKARCSPVRARDGRLYWVEYPEDYTTQHDNYIQTHVIRTPSEVDVFTLFGLDFRPPSRRSVDDYTRQLTSRGHLWPDRDAIDHLLTPLPKLDNTSQPALF